MPDHSQISFEKLHKAKLSSGLYIDRPISPEGEGDVYWASDNSKLLVADTDGLLWVEYDLSSISSGALNAVLDDLEDVSISNPTSHQVIAYNDQGEVWENTNIQDIPIALSDLSDVSFDFSAAGSILAKGIAGWGDMPPGVNGQFLKMDTSTSYKLAWANIESALIDFTNADVPYINLQDQSADPSGDPDAGYAWLFVKDGALFVETDDGVVALISGSGPSVAGLDDLTDVTLTALSSPGEILVYDGVGFVNLGVGADGQILAVDSSQPLGVKWVAQDSYVANDDNAILMYLGLGN